MGQWGGDIRGGDMSDQNGASEFETVGEEDLRFIRNFNDVFLSLGLAVLIAGIGLISMLIASQQVAALLVDGIFNASRPAALFVAGVGFADAAIVWMLGEVFARSRRLFLPAIVILIGFVGFIAMASAWTFGASMNLGQFGSVEAAAYRVRLMGLVVASSVTLAALAFYIRMKLPFAIAVTVAGACATGLAAIGLADEGFVLAHFAFLQFSAGLVLFLMGVYFDARDPARRTRLSDNGFWLHLFAAPLIFTSVIGSVGGGALVTLLIVSVFALVSLLINRRALLVAGLLSAAFAVATLVGETGLEGGWGAGTTLLLLGGAMVMLGGGWHSARRVLVAPFPKTGLIARIIPPEPSKQARRTG